MVGNQSDDEEGTYKNDQFLDDIYAKFYTCCSQ